MPSASPISKTGFFFAARAISMSDLCSAMSLPHRLRVHRHQIYFNRIANYTESLKGAAVAEGPRWRL
jgi:hypothetical protein